MEEITRVFMNVLYAHGERVVEINGEQPEPKDKWKPENVSYNEFGGKAE